MANAHSSSESNPSERDQDGAASPPPELPEVPGGWELRRFSLPMEQRMDLWVPRAPDDLLDDEAVQDRNRFNDAMPYWAWLWDSAPTMATLLVAREWAPGARVLEIGAGLGMAGIAVAASADVALTLTDHDPLALAAMRANASQNHVSAAVRHFDWRHPETLSEGAFDGVIGCDVIYEGQAHGPLLAAFWHALSPNGTAYVADPGRTRLPQFLRRAQDAGFRTELLDERGLPAVPDVGAFRLVLLRRERP